MAQVLEILLRRKSSYLPCIVNSMDAADLATQEARTSAAKVLTKFSRNIPVLTPEGFTVGWTLVASLYFTE